MANVIGNRPQNVVGLKFGRLTIIATSRKMLGDRDRNRYVVATCDCGENVAVQLAALKRGDIQSCGCLQKDFARQLMLKNKYRVTHGESRNRWTKATREHGIWWGMIQRCEYIKHNSYKDYGGRGIKVCARWRRGENGLSGYQCFLADMGRKPTPQHSLDRINNNGHYDPSNCRWATVIEQLQNRRVKTKVHSATRG